MADQSTKIRFTKKQILLITIVAFATVIIVALSYFLYFSQQLNFAWRSSLDVRLAKAEKYAKDNQNVPDNQVVFFGDSITNMFRLDDFFPDKNYVNRGISGDRTHNLFDRVDSNVIAIKPRIIVLLVGANDVPHESPNTTIVTYRKLLERIHTQLPDTKVLVQGILPVTERKAVLYDALINNRTNETIMEFNALIEQLVTVELSEYGYTYAYTGAAVKTVDGKLRDDYSVEGLHLNQAGYTALSGAIKVELAKLDV